MLYIDQREMRSAVPHEINNLLSKSDITVKQLKSSDYCFGDVGIERKTTSTVARVIRIKGKYKTIIKSDLISSLYDRRLWVQLKTLRDTYKYPFLLLEGQIDWSDSVVAGALNAILLHTNIKLIFTTCEKQTGTQIVKMYQKYGSQQSSSAPPPVVIRATTVKDCRWAMLQCIRGIGPNGAKKIMEAIPQLFIRFQDTDPNLAPKLTIKEDLDKIKGLNKEAKEILVKVFTE
jgi:ERCC4-type nuclease